MNELDEIKRVKLQRELKDSEKHRVNIPIGTAINVVRIVGRTIRNESTTRKR